MLKDAAAISSDAAVPADLKALPANTAVIFAYGGAGAVESYVLAVTLHPFKVELFVEVRGDCVWF